MLIIGTRGSKLALTQTSWVRDQIQRRFPDAQLEIKIIKTTADRDQLMPLRSASLRGVFVKEIEEALIAGEIDLAVHSAKDMPTKLPDPLEISVIPEREDARDALLSAPEITLVRELPQGAVVGTGSIRRQAQVLALRPDLRVTDIRGNVDTRLETVRVGQYAAIILACAGLHRLGLSGRISARLDLSEMLPAPGQGALALETRKDDARVRSLISFLNHEATASAVHAERAFLRHIGGGCNSPVAVYACHENGRLKIEGLAAIPDGSRIIRDSIFSSPSQAEQAALSLADRILFRGGAEILAPLRK